MKGKTWADIAKDGHEAKEREARRQLEVKQRKALDLERQRLQEKDALRRRQTERLDEIKECCTNIKQVFSKRGILSQSIRSIPLNTNLPYGPFLSTLSQLL